MTHPIIRPRPLGSACVIAAIMLAAASSASAQGLASYYPVSWDYGDVALGESAVQIFTIESGGLCGGVPATIALTVYVVMLSPDPVGSSLYEGDAFQITGYPSSYTVPASESRDIEVTFAPSSLGMHEAYLYFLSNACDGNAEIALPIQGNGVPDEGDPTELMAELFDFLDTSVSDGSVVGDGPGSSAPGRLKAFGNMLEAADDLIASDEIGLACVQLQDALDRTDGMHPPPDFVGGEDKGVLELMVLDVMETLGCF